MQNLFANYVITKKSGANSERSALVEQFVERLNAERTANKMKPLKPSFYAIKMSHIPLADLYYFFSICKQSKSGFSKCWWGALRVRPASIIS